MRVALVPLSTSDTEQLERFCAGWNAAWPDDPLAPVELAWELGVEARAHRWIVEPGEGDGGPLGVVHVERIRWNEDDAPPIAWIGLVPGARSDAAYRMCLAACAEAARAWGFEELRVSCWEEDEQLLIDLLEGAGFECREREVHVALDVAGVAEQVGGAAATVAGVRITTLADEPELVEAAWSCFVEASADVPGDEPVAAITLADWQRERTAPWVRDDACFLAVADDGDVVGFADIEHWSLPGDVAWHGYTAVRPAWRGRGVAVALKLRTIAWARGAGVRQLRTENEASNAPMRHINARLGYAPLAVRSDWRGPVEVLLA